MINKDKMVLNEYIYWTCQYSGAVKVKILEVIDDKTVRVDTPIKKQAPLVRDLEFIFNKEEHAKKSMKDWERAERKRKQAEKAPLKAEKKAKKHQLVVDNLHSAIKSMNEKGFCNCFVQITKGCDIWGGCVLSEFGFEDKVSAIICENGDVVLIDEGDSKFTIEADKVSSVRNIGFNKNDMVKPQSQFSYVTKDNNRVRVYFDYK